MFTNNIGLLYSLLAVLALICLNVILGVAIAFKEGTAYVLRMLQVGQKIFTCSV